MRATRGRPLMLLMAVVLVGSGCAASVAPSAPDSPTPSSTGVAATAISSADPSSAAAPASPSTESAMPAGTSSGVAVGTMAVTEVDGLRVRSKPRVAEDSFKFEPLLPKGAQVYVLAGPVSGSGYTWYEVAPLTSRTLPQGWIAERSRTGEPWLAPDTFACPPVPTDFRTLAALPPAVGLACFPRIPITVVARLISCNCDVDGGWFTPRWFSSGTGSPEMLVEPESTRPPSDVGEWFWLNLDPAGQRPEALPLGELVKVTGMFDHPDAAGCTLTELEGEPVASQHCRLAFAVGSLVPHP